MSSPRDDFLRQVRQAVAEGNRAGGAAPLPQRGSVGYQGAGSDLLARFVQECTTAGGQSHVVAHEAAATALLMHLLREHEAQRVLLGRGAALDALGLGTALASAGIQVIEADAPNSAQTRPAWFAADVGISAVDFLIAETGSLVLASRPGQPRSLSLLPPIHIAIAQRSQIVPDLFDLFERQSPDAMPSALTLITGPSKTGDIELRLVTGVHGPGTVHVIVIEGPVS